MKHRQRVIHGMTKTRFYNIWVGMIQRCYNSNKFGYKYYGGKGITVEWQSFLDFKRDMYNSYVEHSARFSEANTTIDRKDSIKNYSKENCRWATRLGQVKNKGNNEKYFVFMGERVTLSILATRVGMK